MWRLLCLKIQIEMKLKYIGLDLENIPSFLKDSKEIDYRPIKVNEENTYKVYKYIPISNIEILLTPTNRLNTIKEKYTKASRLITYLNPKEENDIFKHTTFLKMLKEVEIREIEKIEKEQKELLKQIPYKVRFEENYLWQIYYSDIQNIYFMLVPTEDLEYASFFYLLKKKIELSKTDKEEMIFVPICYENYSEQYVKNSEISDLEKYIWFFTKEWPNIYEVYNKKGELSIQIVGKTIVYNNIKSDYKVKLENKEEALKFYKLLKALFILETELPHYYEFIVKINQYGGLDFRYEQKKITYDNMLDILSNEYLKAKDEIVKLEEAKTNLEEQKEKLKIISNKKGQEYLAKEKQIATYLEYKKTFFGRVKYFFKAKKMKKEVTKIEETEEVVEPEKRTETVKTQFINKDYYTIDDIVKIYKDLDIIKSYVKNLELDTNALINKIENMENKIKNATAYIEEIDKHEKSIFEFWKFANKDDSLMLNEGSIIEDVSKNKIEKVYDYVEDMEEIGELVDKTQRKFTEQEKDAIYIGTTDLINVLNHLDNNDIIEKSLDTLKEETNNRRILFSTDKMDIFGEMADNNTKIKVLGGKKHRETAKDILKILEINTDTTIEEYKEKLIKILATIKQCIENVREAISIPVYIKAEKIDELNDLKVFDINLEEIIQNSGNKEINIYKINVKSSNKVVYFSNCIYYNNYNKTLPLGMDVGTKCLLNIDKDKLKKVSKDDFRISIQTDDFKVNTKKVNIYEYEIVEENDDK